MKRTVFTSIAILFLTGACVAATENPRDDSPMKIMLTGLKEPQPESYILGEPVTVQFSWENTTDKPLTIASHIGINTSVMRLHIEGDTNSDCDLFSKLITLGYLDDHQVLQPSERIVKSIDVRKMGMVEVGEYEIWLTYDATEIGEEYAGGAVAPINVESNHFKFEIVEPVGIDAQAFEKYANACNEMLLNTESRKHITEEFPSSTYAGWVLGGRPYTQDPAAMIEILKKTVAPPPVYNDPPVDKQVAETRSGLKRFALKQINQLTTYLQIRPDFPDADWMNFRIAYLSLEVGDTDRAKNVLEQLVKTKDLPTCFRERVKALHSFAKEKSEEKEQR